MSQHTSDLLHFRDFFRRVLSRGAERPRRAMHVGKRRSIGALVGRRCRVPALGRLAGALRQPEGTCEPLLTSA